MTNEKTPNHIKTFSSFNLMSLIKIICPREDFLCTKLFPVVRGAERSERPTRRLVQLYQRCDLNPGFKLLTLLLAVRKLASSLVLGYPG